MLHTVTQNWQVLYVAQCDMNTELFVCQVTCTDSGPHGTPNDVQMIVAPVYQFCQLSTTSGAGRVCLVTKAHPTMATTWLVVVKGFPLSSTLPDASNLLSCQMTACLEYKATMNASFVSQHAEARHT